MTLRPARHCSIRSAAALTLLVAMSLAGLALLAGPASPATPQAAWPMALHDAEHSGTSNAVGPQSGTISWQRDLGGKITQGPVVGADGTIYAASSLGVLHALNPANGSDRWTFDGGASYAGVKTSRPAHSSWLRHRARPVPSHALCDLTRREKVVLAHLRGDLSPVSRAGVYVVLANATVWAIDVRAPRRCWCGRSMSARRPSGAQS